MALLGNGGDERSGHPRVNVGNENSIVVWHGQAWWISDEMTQTNDN